MQHKVQSIDVMQQKNSKCLSLRDDGPITKLAGPW